MNKTLVGLIAIFVLTLPIVGATITVTNTNDSGPGSLRDAIAGAAAGDTIALGVTGTITLGSTLYIGTSLSISGPGASNLAISGNKSVGVFSISNGLTVNISGVTIENGMADGGGVYTAGTLTLTNSTVSGNSASTFLGGGIYNVAGTLTLVNTTVSGNHAYEGGGILNLGTLTLTNSTVSGNSGYYGGGIYAGGGTTTLTESTVSGNQATDGAGIYNAGTLTLTNTTVSGNSAAAYGGGAHNTGTLTLTNSTISDNSAITWGGGVYNQGPLMVTNSTVSGNSTSASGGGGGVMNDYSMTLTNSSIRNNSAFKGGGIMNYYGAQLTVTNSTVAANSAYYGGGIFNGKTAALINSTVAGNLASTNGGGIYNDSGTLTLKNTLLANGNSLGNCVFNSGTGFSAGHNLADDTTCSIFLTGTGDMNGILAGLDQNGLQNNGGPTQTIALLPTSPAVDAIPVSDCTLLDGVTLITADQRGILRPQGIACDIGAFELGTSFTVTNLNDSGPGSLRDTIASAPTGATIDFSVAGTIILSSTLSITRDLAISGPGASNLAISGNNAVRVLSVPGGQTVNISDVTIENGNGYASTYGGGIYINSGTLTLSNCTISGNSASYGGGIFNYDGAVMLTNCAVSANSAGIGGGIYDGGVLTATNSTLSGNSADDHGGGIYQAYGKLTLVNSTISGNSVSHYFGGGIFNWGGIVTLSNGTVSGNSASVGGGIYMTNGGALTLKNTILANSFSGGNCSLTGTSVSYGYNLSDDSTCSGFLTATGDLDNTPAGLDPNGLQDNGGPTRTIAILPTSPAADAIPVSPNNYCTLTDGTTPIATDQRGIARPQGSACDIGAFEILGGAFHPPASIAVSSGSGQSATISTPFANPLTATVLDSGGHPVSSVTVTFTAPPSGPGGAFAGSLSVSATTNASGVATSPTFAANSSAGSYNVAATVAGVATPANFSLTNIPGPAASIAATGGGGQNANVNTNFANPLAATVLDSGGNPVSGVTVTFTAPSSGASGTFAGSTTANVSTNGSGVATSPTVIANSIAGLYSVAASVGGVVAPATFSLTNTSGAPASITATSGASQSATINTNFANPLVAAVRDSGGNPVFGVTVTFKAPPGSGASGIFSNGLTSATAVTNASGVATSSVFTANSKTGSYNVTVAATGVAITATFSLTNTARVPATISATSGSIQNSAINTTFANPLAATVLDSGGNPVSGVTVTFTAPASGASGSFAGSVIATVVTNASGVATSPKITANSAAGSYAVVATVAGVGTPASFLLTNIAGAAASITATAGGGQSATVNTAFASPLVATVLDSGGNPVAGAIVTFKAPPGSGASGTFVGLSSTTATTDASGVAMSPTVTANGRVGSYNVTATVPRVSTPATFPMTNKP